MQVLNHYGRTLFDTTIREHLYRVHKDPITCGRCQEPFDNQVSLDSHLQKEISCELRPAKATRGITPAMEKELRLKKKTERTREETWNCIYQLLLPGTTLPASPCKSSLLSPFQVSAIFLIFLIFSCLPPELIQNLQTMR